MIVRIWRGSTRFEDATRYAEYVRETGIAAYRKIPGHLGSQLLWRRAGDLAEFVLVSMWSGMEAIEHYAGSYPEWAVFYPEDRRYLVTYDACVTHYQQLYHDGTGLAGTMDDHVGS